MDSIVPYKEAFSKYIPEQYKNSEKLLSLVNTCLEQCDSLENAFFEILQSLNLQDAIGPALDWLGAIVGVERIPGESDTSYRSHIVSGMNLKNLPSNEALRLVIKFLTGCDSVGLFPNWPAETYYVLDGSTDADLSALEHDSMTSGASLVRGTFLCMEQGEGGYIVNEDNGMPFVVDYVNLMDIPNNVLRFTFSQADYDPTVAGVGPHGTWTKVANSSRNEWDWSGTPEHYEFDSVFNVNSENPSLTNWVSILCSGWTTEADMYEMFYGCSAITSVKLYGMTGVINMYAMFWYCTNMKEIVITGAVNNKNISYLCDNCENLETVFIDTVGVLDSDVDSYYKHGMHYSFAYCYKLKNVKIANLSSVKHLRWTFYRCENLESIYLDIPNCEKLISTFEKCYKLKNVTLEHSENVADFNSTFAYCTSMEKAPEIDTFGATYFGYVFRGCTALKEIPKYNLYNVQTLFGTFSGCTLLEYVPDLNTKNLDLLSQTFFGCLELREIPKWDYSKVKVFDTVFYGCTALKEIPEWLDVSSATNTVYYIFAECLNIERGARELYDKLSVISPEYHENCFRNCGVNTIGGIGDLCKIPTTWGGLGPIPAKSLLFNFGKSDYDPTVTTTSNHGTWTRYNTGYSGNTFNLWIWTYDSDDWYYVFSRDVVSSYLNNFNNNPVDVVAHGDLTGVKCFCRLFVYASALRYCCDLVIPDASGEHDSTFRGMNHMFANCTHLEVLPKIEVTKLLSMEGFAAGCSRLIEISPIKINSVTGSTNSRAYNAFINCRKVKRGAFEAYVELSRVISDTSEHNVTGCFSNCGVDTLTGLSDLLKIPASWGGLGDNLSARSIVLAFSNSDFDPSQEMETRGTWTHLTGITAFNAWKLSDSSHPDWSFAFSGELQDADNQAYILGSDMATVNNVTNLFTNCHYVNGGALELYGQLSQHITDPEKYVYAFYGCGDLTENGLIELLQVPASWGGDQLTFCMPSDNTVAYNPTEHEADVIIQSIRYYQDVYRMLKNSGLN